jgi:mono/diheme cytochrome c family protein
MNKQQRVGALLVGLLSLSSGPALADEQAIKLKDGPGRDAVETNCGICHSLDYIEMNSPFPDEKLWQAEVAKMINVFGAPVEPDEAKTVIDYLVSNYGDGSANRAPK